MEIKIEKDESSLVSEDLTENNKVTTVDEGVVLASFHAIVICYVIKEQEIITHVKYSCENLVLFLLLSMIYGYMEQ